MSIWPIPYAITFAPWPDFERVYVRDTETGEERWVSRETWDELSDAYYLGQAARQVLRHGYRAEVTV